MLFIMGKLLKIHFRTATFFLANPNTKGIRGGDVAECVYKRRCAVVCARGVAVFFSINYFLF